MSDAVSAAVLRRGILCHRSIASIARRGAHILAVFLVVGTAAAISVLLVVLVATRGNRPWGVADWLAVSASPVQPVAPAARALETRIAALQRALQSADELAAQRESDRLLAAAAIVDAVAQAPGHAEMVPGARPLAYLRAAAAYARTGAEEGDLASLDRARELLRLASAAR